ncbi:MAG: 50S ribosomal protein L4 [Erysipelotrichaceae bacterium]|nr:50S ribosomal protein L4 [Erysipelotrichaceae bacterium]MBO4537341.1 50S ribosomal protein L4 [Erysipelotrichaceae bacterium]MBR5048070.1 50S ribosomal protein L4 [Erysipelotrichaceae bacterium]
MTLKVSVTNQKGEKLHDIKLNEAVWGVEPNQQAMFDAVVMQQASLRQGTHDTKGRSEVSGGGKKPYRQKGTGRARQGSIRAPQFRGGGIVFGPTPRSYRYHINRKVARLALRSYLSTFAAAGTLKVVDKFEFEEIKTKAFTQVMKDLGVDRKVLFVFDEDEDWENAWLSMRNLQDANFEFANSVSCLELANTYTLVCTEAAVNKIQEGLK